VWMSRRGQPRLALTLVGVTSLLASPISWSHHYVWVVVLAVVLWQERGLPRLYRWLALAYCAWIAAAPFMWLPMGGDVEYRYDSWELAVDDLGIVAGVALLAGSVAIALGRWGRAQGHGRSPGRIAARELVGSDTSGSTAPRPE
jgi:alpha-1,2-mannosyltransferase